MRRLHFFLVPLGLLLALNLAACGNKGPLVHPTPAQDIEDVDAVEDDGEADEASGVEETAGPHRPGVDADGQAAPADPVGDTDPAAEPPAADPGHG